MQIITSVHHCPMGPESVHVAACVFFLRLCFIYRDKAVPWFATLFIECLFHGDMGGVEAGVSIGVSLVACECISTFPMTAEMSKLSKTLSRSAISLLFAHRGFGNSTCLFRPSSLSAAFLLTCIAP